MSASLAGGQRSNRIAEPSSARVRRRITERGLKPLIDFQNADTDGAERLAALGGAATPALWDGARLVSGAAAVEDALGRVAQPGR